MAAHRLRSLLTARASRLATGAIAFVTVVAACGCAENAPAPVVLDAAGIQPQANYADLGAVLKAGVTSGLIVPSTAKDWTGRLDSQLRILAVSGPAASPELFPTADDRLTYWYNARAAWSLKLVQLAGFPKELSAAWLEDRPLPLDGRTMTLKNIDALLADQGWQVLVAAPGVLVQRAALPDGPFSAQDVRGRIDERLNEFVDSDGRVNLDIANRRVLIAPVLWQYREPLLQRYRGQYGDIGATFTTVLLRYVTGSAHRRLQEAVGYPCLPAPPSRALAVKDESIVHK